MKQKIHLHIGKHKTGSTSIQSYQLENSSQQWDHGYHVVKEKSMHENVAKVLSTNQTELAHCFLRSNLLTPLRLRGVLSSHKIKNIKQALITGTDFRNHLKTISSPNIIISAEAFSFMRKKREIWFLRYILRGYDSIPIFYSRERNSWLKTRTTYCV